MLLQKMACIKLLSHSMWHMLAVQLFWEGSQSKTIVYSVSWHNRFYTIDDRHWSSGSQRYFFWILAKVVSHNKNFNLDIQTGHCPFLIRPQKGISCGFNGSRAYCALNLKQVSKFWHICSISCFTQCQLTLCLAQSRHLFTPWWPWIL